MKRYDCTDGGSSHCYGCYTMTQDDQYGDYVTYEDFAAERAAREAAEADARRWRWARDHVGGTAWNEHDYATVTIGLTVPKNRGTCAFEVNAEMLDAAIDAAIDTQGGE